LPPLGPSFPATVLLNTVTVMFQGMPRVSCEIRLRDTESLLDWRCWRETATYQQLQTVTMVGCYYCYSQY